MSKWMTNLIHKLIKKKYFQLNDGRT